MIIIIGNIIGVSIKNIANNTPNDDISFPPFFLIIFIQSWEVKEGVYMIKTNIGYMPLEDYFDYLAHTLGYDSYEEMQEFENVVYFPDVPENE